MFNQIRSLITFVSLLISLSSALALSSTIGDLANSLTLQAPPWEMLITGASYIIGIAFIISGVIKIKNHREAPQQVPLSAPMVLMAIGVFLVYLPSTISVLAGTFFGDGSATTGNYYFGQQKLMDGSTLANVVKS